MRHVDGGDTGRTALGGIEGKGPGMGKAVEDVLSGGNLGDGQAVVFLIQEEARLLAVFDVDIIADAIFFDSRDDTARFRKEVGFIPAFILFHAVQFADFDVVSFIDAADGDTHGLQFIDQSLEDDGFHLVHAVA